MLGAIIGDIVGSTREFHNVKTEEFELLPAGSRFTDDTVMTLAVAQWLMDDPRHSAPALVRIMREMGHKHPRAGYGKMFRRWLNDDNPRPYGSYGNGSAMRVSPVGLYAASLDEALRLARLTAEVTHNHPEGIKGAQAVAACIFMQRHRESKAAIREYVESTFGYDLGSKLEDLRHGYTFDSSCQGSVPIAIMAFLQRDNALDALRLAVSMGGDSDTIGCITASIACAHPAHYHSLSTTIPGDVAQHCRALLTPGLRDINDRFEAFATRPLYQSFPVNDWNTFAGEYPGDKDEVLARDKIEHMVNFGVRHFVDLTEEDELLPYSHLLPEGTTHTRFAVPDCGAPEDPAQVQALIKKIRLLGGNSGTYIHCHGGVGRTGTIVACLLAEEMRHPTTAAVMDALRQKFAAMPKSKHRVTPETPVQMRFIEAYVDFLLERERRVKDCVRGSLMAGAAGDALGYPVEFVSRREILARYGAEGITQFDLDRDGKALVSDDTQMTLFTACGMLMGITRGYMRGVGGQPENYVSYAYLDWYYTQTGRKHGDLHTTWLRDLPQLAHRRAPGTTCLDACEALFDHRNPQNNSKGCGGIMRVAPMGLLNAALHGYDTAQVAQAGATIARATHLHPQGFLPAALLTVVLERLVPLTPTEAADQFTLIVDDALEAMTHVDEGKHLKHKEALKALTLKAVRLAHSNLPDSDAIATLGQGWTAEEAWAIALFCAMRHVHSTRDAIIAAVNHDGDSDSTGSIAGNIMGAIHGYEALLSERLFCPPGREFDDTLELHNIILTLADDLTTGCPISEYSPIDTPEQRQWFQRYCKMLPAGL